MLTLASEILFQVPPLFISRMATSARQGETLWSCTRRFLIASSQYYLAADKDPEL